MSEEPAEIFERAAEEGFITQVRNNCVHLDPRSYAPCLQLKHHSTCSQFGQLRGALNLDGEIARSHFEDILYNQVSTSCLISDPHMTMYPKILSGKFSGEFSKLEEDFEKEGSENPLNELYRRTNETALAQAEKRVRARLAGLL